MDALDRLCQRLAEAVLRNSPGPLDRPLTIADIYQHLVPYRLVRAELGFSELKEYEHSLLRLLAGEREYVQVDLEQVVEEFRRELRSPNPILGMYRDYAAVGAALNPKAVQAAGASPQRAPALTPAPTPAPTAALAATPAPASAAPEVSRGSAAPAEPAPSPRRRPTACWSCREPLPADREVRFCPHCGGGQLPFPCSECGTELEPEWRFCIQCGDRSAAAATGGNPV